MEYFLADLASFITNNLQVIIIVLMVLLVLALIVFVSINIRLARLNKQYRKLMQGMDGANLEQLLMAHIDEVRQVVRNVDALEGDCRSLAAISKLCIQRTGVVRFNAFEDTGSDLSFAIALLDANNNGVILSSIFGRSESRVYAKPIQGGASSYFLTDEEKAALSQALEKR